MAVLRVQTAKAGTAAPNVSSLAAIFGSNVAAGNLLIAIVRVASSGVVSSVTDSQGNTWTLRASNVGVDPKLYLYSAVAGASSANTVTATFSTTANFRWLFCVEYAGADAFDVADDKNGTNATDLVSDPFSTTAAGVVVLAGSQNGFAVYTAGADFTIVDGSIGSGTSFFGGVEERITSGSLSSYTGHLTSNVGAGLNYVTVTAAFTAAAGGHPAMRRFGRSPIGVEGVRVY